RTALGAVFHDHLSASVADDLFSGRSEYRLRLFRYIRHHRCGDRWRPGAGDADAGLQSLQRRPAWRRPRRLGRAVRHLDADRCCADQPAVPLRRAQGHLLMIENRRWGNLPAHLVLITGVIIVAFPVYIAVIASTHSAETIANGQ